MERKNFSQQLEQIIQELSREWMLNEAETMASMELNSHVGEGLIERAISGRTIKYYTLEKLAIGMDNRLPIVFYDQDGRMINLGEAGFPKNHLPDNYIGRVFQKYRLQLKLEPQDIA